MTYFGIPLTLSFVFASIIPSNVLAAGRQCDNVQNAISIIHARSLRQIAQVKSVSGSDYRVDLVRAFRVFDLQRSRVNADGIFRLLPKNDKEYEVWMTMGDSLCESEDIVDMATLDNFSLRFSRLLAKAVVESPGNISDYIKFIILSSQDVSNNFGKDVDLVCKARHRLFVGAVNDLQKHEARWFSTHVINVNSCQLLSLPEAEN